MSRWRCRSRVPERVRRSCRRAARPRSGSPDWRTSARARVASARDTSGRGRAPPPTPSAPTRSRCRPCPRLMPLLRLPRAAYPTAMSFSSALRFSTLQLRGLDRDSRRVVDSTRRSMHNAPIGWWVLQWGAGAGRAGAASAGEGVDAGYDYAGVGHGPVPAGAQRHRARGDRRPGRDPRLSRGDDDRRAGRPGAHPLRRPGGPGPRGAPRRGGRRPAGRVRPGRVLRRDGAARGRPALRRCYRSDTDDLRPPRLGGLPPGPARHSRRGHRPAGRPQPPPARPLRAPRAARTTRPPPRRRSASAVSSGPGRRR